MRRILILGLLMALPSFYIPHVWAQDLSPVRESSVVHPAWSRTANIYEVNTRQFTREGTFQAFNEHLPHLKELGVDILWFMPINPIGKVNRKGTLGSYYSVLNYLAVNPEFGTLEDFKETVKAAHALGMRVILDWVANHCAWDNPLATDHPDWFTHDSLGHFAPPVPDWKDVIDLNYDNPELRKYMTDALCYWVRECDIDGFRCDVAGMVPLDFWVAARAELEKIKPVFILAEDEQPRCHAQAFDMTYSWSLHHLMNDIAKGKKKVADLELYFQRDAQDFPPDSYRMRFTDNHDENSWAGTVYERMGKFAEPFAVLTLTAPGMPLIYSGQEAGLNHRLSFFEKDSIPWQKNEFADIYQKLLALKHQNPTLANGQDGAPFERVKTNHDNQILSFKREQNGHGILVVLNVSKKKLDVLLPALTSANYRDVMTSEPITIDGQTKLGLKPCGWKVFEKK
jgi:cyclomaltodextrinase / maltogenic alpha-amylase / neopullulanase